VWIDYLSGINSAQTAWPDREISHQRLGLTDTILCEVLQGVRGEGAFARMRNDLSKFQVFTTGGIDLIAPQISPELEPSNGIFPVAIS
jgi:hypothetical protein